MEEKLKKRILSRRRLPRIALGGALLVLAATALIIHRNRPRPTWYVEPGLEQQWGELLKKAPRPPPFTRQSPYDPAAGLRKGHYGVIITTTFPKEGTDSNTKDLQNSDTAPSPESPWEPPVRLFPGLYRDREDYRGAIPLALDPWLVFHKTGDPPLTLERVLDPAGSPGTLIIPGAEPDAVHAWVTQLLQSSPGDFPREKQVWDEAEQRLIYGNRRFQQGALTYTWFDVWFLLLNNETAWVYAPLSMTRNLSSYDTGRLDDALFPIPRDWNTYGIQAEILWAVPKPPEKQAADIDEAKAWLSAPEIQTLIAEILGWIPAQPGSRPYDTLARKAQVAWFSSSFVWH
jgi:hypothetical protein